MKKFYAFAVLCVAVLAALGGTAYLFYFGKPVFGIANLALAAMAFPFVKEKVAGALKEK